MDIRRKRRSDCEHIYVIHTSRVLSPDRTWPDRWLSEMHGSRRVGLGTTVEYIERKFSRGFSRHGAPWPFVLNFLLMYSSVVPRPTLLL